MFINVLLSNTNKPIVYDEFKIRHIEYIYIPRIINFASEPLDPIEAKWISEAMMEESFGLRMTEYSTGRDMVDITFKPVHIIISHHPPIGEYPPENLQL